MDRKILAFLAVLLLSGSACAGSVTRSFSPQAVEPGKDVTVTLMVDVSPGETYYAIDEALPGGWQAKESADASMEQEGHLKWLALEGAEDTEYTYVVAVPNAEGIGEFSGIYMFEGMNEEAEIGGSTGIEIVGVHAGNWDGNGSSAQTLDLAGTGAIIAIAALGAVFFALKKRQGLPKI